MKQRGWAIYFWFVVVISAIDVAVLVAEGTEPPIAWLVGLPFIAAMLVAVWGLAHQKALATWLWPVCSYACALWYVGSISVSGTGAADIAAALLLAPAVAAVFAYKRWLLSGPVEI